MAVSLNLTEGTHVPVDAAEYGAPLMLTSGLICMEVVFWAPRYDAWIVLVRERTGRSWPPSAKVREVAAGELEHYAAALQGGGS